MPKSRLFDKDCVLGVIAIPTKIVDLSKISRYGDKVVATYRNIPNTHSGYEIGSTTVAFDE